MAIGVEYGCKFVLEGPAAISSANQTLNPGFETDLSNWNFVAASWTEAAASREAAAFSGSSGGFVAALKGKKDNNTTARSVSYVSTTPEGFTQPGKKYTATAVVNVIDNVASGIRLRIDWYNGGVFLSTTQGELFTSTGIATLTVSAATAPASATRASVVIIGTSAVANDTFNIQIDNVTYQENGPRAVFNDSTDADFVGALDPEQSSGIDSADVREDAADKTEDDGGIHGNFFYGRRPIVLAGTVIASSAVDRNEKVDKIKAASNATRSNATLYMYPTSGPGSGITTVVRRQQPLRITKGYVKAFQIPLVAADSKFYSTSISKLYEYSQSPLTLPSSVISSITEDGSIGTVAWTEILRAGSEGSGWAIATLGSGAASKYLKVNFFTEEKIPAKATILGIEVKIRGKFQALEVGAAVFDNSVRVYKEGVLSGSNFASGSAWTEVNTTRSYGGAANLWGTTWTPAQLNKEFAAAISMKNTGTKTGAGEIDVITAVITYSAEGRKQAITVEGSVETKPVIKIYGPFENPTVKNVTTGNTLTLNYVLVNPTEYLEIDFANHTIKKNGTLNVYGAALNFAASTWWNLIPGINEFEVTSALKSEITYKPAWL